MFTLAAQVPLGFPRYSRCIGIRCLFELYTAIGQAGKVEIDVILTEEEHQSFVEAMRLEGYSCIDNAVGSIHSENATASRDDDLEAIRSLVLSKPGGFATLNATVSQQLYHWFENHGALRSATRISRTRSRQQEGFPSAESQVSDNGNNVGDGYLNIAADVQLPENEDLFGFE